MREAPDADLLHEQGFHVGVEVVQTVDHVATGADGHQNHRNHRRPCARRWHFARISPSTNYARSAGVMSAA
jgi:hypothetical protein